MGVGAILAIILYVFGMVPTYCLFNEVTNQSKFNKAWFTLFWPAVSMIYPIMLLAKKSKK